MLRTASRPWATFVLLVGCLGLACNLTPSSPSPPGDVAPIRPTTGSLENPTTAAPTEAAAEQAKESAPDTLDLSTLEDIQFPTNVGSYHVTLDQRFESAQASGGSHAEGGVTLVPPAATLIETRQGDAVMGDSSPSEQRVIDGVITILKGGACDMINPMVLTDPAPPTQLLPNPSRFLTGGAAWVEGGVSVNGRVTDHYALDVSNIDSSLMKLESLDSGDVYIDAQDGFLVKLAFRGEGINNMLAWAGLEPSGTTTYEVNYHEFETPVDVQPLERCGPVPETDWPLVDGDILRYQTELGSSFFDLTVMGRLDEAIAFYKSELASDGWHLASEESASERRASLTFTDPSGATLTLDFRNDSPQGQAADKLDIITISFVEFDF
jgi:hypothetical protein